MGGLVDIAKYQNEIENHKLKRSPMLSGTQGFCFIDGQKIIKIYNKPKDMERKLDLTGYSSSKIAFPNFYLYKDGKIYGEVMPYFDSKTIEFSIKETSNLSLIEKGYLDMINEIKLYPDIRMLDLRNLCNVLYSPDDGFYLIDTTLWYKTKDESDSNIYDFKAILVERIMYNIIFEHAPRTQILRDIYIGYWITKKSSIGRDLINLIKCNLNLDFHFIELIEAYKNVIKTYYDIDVETIKDIKKYTKIMKNS